ncbi:MAG TPA: hypothetical protein PKE54_24130, partial [Candidatus Obscuribacter sp.]|nr:hypothetical protein [Candidatus Obscuribacter sp.]
DKIDGGGGRYGRASEETEAQIDREIKKIVDDCVESTRNLIKSKRAELDKIARALVEKETLYYRDLVAILEPTRSQEDIEREINALAERKQVGTPAVISLDLLPGLTGISTGNGKNGKKNGNGSHSDSSDKPDATGAAGTSQDKPADGKDGENQPQQN